MYPRSRIKALPAQRSLAAWDVMTKTVRMHLTTMIVRRTARITIITIAVIWIALKQITTIVVKQVGAIMENTTMTAIIIKADNRTQNSKMCFRNPCWSKEKRERKEKIHEGKGYSGHVGRRGFIGGGVSFKGSGL